MQLPELLLQSRSAAERVLIAEGLLIAQAICARHMTSGVKNPLLAAMEEIVEKMDELQQQTD